MIQKFCHLYLTFCQAYFTFVAPIMNECLENRIRVLRAEMEITQEELGKKCGLSRQSINAIEKGKFIPSILSAIRIANFFNVTIEEVFFIKRK